MNRIDQAIARVDFELKELRDAWERDNCERDEMKERAGQSLHKLAYLRLEIHRAIGKLSSNYAGVGEAVKARQMTETRDILEHALKETL